MLMREQLISIKNALSDYQKSVYDCDPNDGVLEDFHIEMINTMFYLLNNKLDKLLNLSAEKLCSI